MPGIGNCEEVEGRLVTARGSRERVEIRRDYLMGMGCFRAMKSFETRDRGGSCTTLRMH